ncbi:hypothetical protein DPMN_109479 [Dreissena polymorpha]|uniref:Uncharacterized protein n=1 Tax=Dreissena polymorpha TaxID=45954 RepID=A0A9D4KAU2_DREPO|nr:hypothetical protein DPMN_109479 [Dreissena polymorpha]
MIPIPYHGIDLKTLPDLQLYKLNPASHDSQTISWHRSKNSTRPAALQLTQPAMISRPYHGIDLKTLPDLQLYKLNPASHDPQTISWHRSKTSTRPAAVQTQPSQP